MTDESSSTPSGATAPSGSGPSQGAWVGSILFAGLIGWLGYSFPPMTWQIPEDMLHIGALSPQSEQDELAAVMAANLWKNTLLKFGLAGVGLGLSGLILHATKLGRHWLPAIVTLVSGIVCGLLAGTLGLMLHRHLALGHPLPLINEATRPLVCESAVFALVSILLLLPISVLLLLQPEKSQRHKAVSVPLAGLLTGMLVPFTAAIILPADTASSVYPPTGIGLTLLWFAAMALLTLLLVVFMGSRQPSAPPAAES